MLCRTSSKLRAVTSKNRIMRGKPFIHGYQYFVNQLPTSDSEFRKTHYRYINHILTDSQDEENMYIAKLETIVAAVSENTACIEAARLAAVSLAASDKLSLLEKKKTAKYIPIYDNDSIMKAKLKEISSAAALKAAKIEASLLSRKSIE